MDGSSEEPASRPQPDPVKHRRPPVFETRGVVGSAAGPPRFFERRRRFANTCDRRSELRLPAEDGCDLIHVGPRGRIEALGERNEHLLASRIRNALRDSVPDDGMPAHEKRDLLVRGRPLDLRRNRGSWHGLLRLRLMRFGRRLGRRALAGTTRLG